MESIHDHVPSLPAQEAGFSNFEKRYREGGRVGCPRKPLAHGQNQGSLLLRGASKCKRIDKREFSSKIGFWRSLMRERLLSSGFLNLGARGKKLSESRLTQIIMSQNSDTLKGGNQMRSLPEPIYRTTREEAFHEAEQMALMGFAVEIKNHGNVFALVPVENFTQAQNGPVTGTLKIQ